jgi:uncharacterized protein (DUF736 family)
MTESIGALWSQKSQNGKMFLSGNIELEEGKIAKIIVFQNDRKEQGSKQPDYRIFLQKPMVKKDNDDVPF